MAFYIDTSALVKLISAEPESDALREWMEAAERRFATGILTRTELLIAARRKSPELAHRAQRVMGPLTALAITDEMYVEAGTAHDPILRAQDAIHVTTALSVENLEGVVTYDHRMASAAEAEGIPVLAPG